jgi:thiamine-monophosphate kinase
VSDLALGPGREFDAIRAMLARWGPSAVGIGGDAAEVVIPDGQRVLVSTDTSVEGVHFRRDWLSPREIGYRATAAALSDLAAVAATPLALLLSITVPEAWRSALPDVADGVAEAARAARAQIVGGDVVGGDALSLTVTVLGVATHPWSRGAAHPGGRIYVTGALGGPLVALRAWAEGGSPDAGARARFAHPEPRLVESRWLAHHGVVAAIDISDGLVADARHIAAASHVRLTLDVSRVPRVQGIDPLGAAASGEEYELLVVTRPDAQLDTPAFTRAFGLPLSEIGIINADDASGHVDVMLGGVRVDPPSGHDHFSG